MGYNTNITKDMHEYFFKRNIKTAIEPIERLSISFNNRLMQTKTTKIPSHIIQNGYQEDNEKY